MSRTLTACSREDLEYTLDRLAVFARLAEEGLVEDEVGGIGRFFALCEWALRRREPVLALEAALRFRSWAELATARDLERAAERVLDLRRGYGPRFLFRAEPFCSARARNLSRKG